MNVQRSETIVQLYPNKILVKFVISNPSLGINCVRG